MAIDDRIYLSPSHNSIMTWGMNNHTPASSARRFKLTIPWATAKTMDSSALVLVDWA